MGTKNTGLGSGCSRDPFKHNDSVLRIKPKSLSGLAQSAPESNAARARLLRSCASFDHMRHVERVQSTDSDYWIAIEGDLIEAALAYASTTRARVQ